jgi:hypothetical protein
MAAPALRRVTPALARGQGTARRSRWRVSAHSGCDRFYNPIGAVEQAFLHFFFVAFLCSA